MPMTHFLCSVCGQRADSADELLKHSKYPVRLKIKNGRPTSYDGPVYEDRKDPAINAGANEYVINVSSTLTYYLYFDIL